MTKLAQNGDTYVGEFEATFSFNYEDTPNEPSYYMTPYTLTFKYINGELKIVKLDSEDLFYQNGKTRVLQSSKGAMSFKSIESGIKRMINELPSSLGGEDDSSSEAMEPESVSERINDTPPLRSVRHSYSPSAAAKYGRAFGSFVNNGIFKNMEYYGDNEDYGDCANFISQCLWAGYGGTSGYTISDNPIIPTDQSVITALKNRVAANYLQFGGIWMGVTPNSSYTPTGSWMRARTLGEFIRDNTGLGPKGTLYNDRPNGYAWTGIDTNIKKGDVLQFYGCDGNSYYDHSVIVCVCAADAGYSTSEISNDYDYVNIKVAMHTPYFNGMKLLDAISRFQDVTDPIRGVKARVRLIRPSAAYFNE